MRQNCARIAPELRQNCARIARRVPLGERPPHLLVALDLLEAVEEILGALPGVGERLHVVREALPHHARLGLARALGAPREVRLHDLVELLGRHREVDPLVAEGVAEGAAEGGDLDEAAVAPVVRVHQDAQVEVADLYDPRHPVPDRLALGGARAREVADVAGHRLLGHAQHLFDGAVGVVGFPLHPRQLLAADLAVAVVVPESRAEGLRRPAKTRHGVAPAHVGHDAGRGHRDARVLR